LSESMTQGAPEPYSSTELKARFFRVLGDPVRMGILELLLEGEKNVSEIVSRLGMSQSRVSNHLACLRWCGLVSVRRKGSFIYYSLADEQLRELLEIANDRVEHFARSLASCGKLDEEGVPSY